MGKRTCRVAFFFSLFVVMLIMNQLTPFTVKDDPAYSFIKESDGILFDITKPIDSITDVFISQINHWHTINGRFTNHFIGQLFDGLLGKSVFDIVNALIFCLVVYLINLFLFGGKRQLWDVVSVILFFVAIPAFNQTVLWMMGSVNYLWSVFFVLLFLCVLKLHKGQLISKKHWIIGLPIILLGWSHEGFCLPLSGALFIYIIINYKTIYKTAYFPFMLFFMIGTTLSVFAPATFIRADASGVNDVFKVAIDNIKTAILSISRLRVFWMVLCVTLYMLINNKTKTKVFFSENKYLYLVVLFSLAIIVLSGRNSFVRVRFCTEFFSMLLLMKQLQYLGLEKYESATVYITCVVLIILLIPVFFYQKKNYDNYKWCDKQFMNKDVSMILVPQDKTPSYLSSFILPHVEFGESYFPCEKAYWNTPPHPTAYFGMYINAYYGKNGVCYFPQELYDDIVSFPERYENFHSVSGCNLYVRHINKGKMCKEIVYELSEASNDVIPFWIRPFSRWFSTYNVSSCHPTFKTIINIQGKDYLVITKPIKGMAERIKRIKMVY